MARASRRDRPAGSPGRGRCGAHREIPARQRILPSWQLPGRPRSPLPRRSRHRSAEPGTAPRTARELSATSADADRPAPGSERRADDQAGDRAVDRAAATGRRTPGPPTLGRPHWAGDTGQSTLGSQPRAAGTGSPTLGCRHWAANTDRRRWAAGTGSPTLDRQHWAAKAGHRTPPDRTLLDDCLTTARQHAAAGAAAANPPSPDDFPPAIPSELGRPPGLAVAPPARNVGTATPTHRDGARRREPPDLPRTPGTAGRADPSGIHRTDPASVRISMLGRAHLYAEPHG